MLYRIRIDATLGIVSKRFIYVILTKDIEKTKKQLYNTLVNKGYDSIVFKYVDEVEEDDCHYWERIGQNYSIVAYDIFTDEYEENGNLTSTHIEYAIDNEEIV